jgi:hypothetical protein
VVYALITVIGKQHFEYSGFGSMFVGVLIVMTLRMRGELNKLISYDSAIVDLEKRLAAIKQIGTVSRNDQQYLSNTH